MINPRIPFMSFPLIYRARAFAVDTHRSQRRGISTKEPYVLHLAEVAWLVEASGGSPEQIAAAWLHDTVEDQDVTHEEIEQVFGAEVSVIVRGLTDDEDMAKLRLRERKTLQAKRVRTKSSGVKRVKLGDQTSNIICTTFDPPTTWERQKCIDYIETAALIAEACSGVSQYLDQKFCEAYTAAAAKYGLL